MEIKKEEIVGIIKKNGLNEDVAEQLLEVLAKGLGGSIVDLIKLAAEKSENKIDDMIVLAGEEKLKELIGSIKVNL